MNILIIPLAHLLNAKGSLDPVGCNPIEKKLVRVSRLLLRDKMHPKSFLG